MKWCNGCEQTKLESDYHRDSTKNDGLHSWCKKCRAISQRNYHQTKAGKDVNRRSQKRYYQTHSEQISARSAINNATKTGKCPHISTQQGNVCGAPAKHYHHSKGYEEKHWLKVIPLCRSCHKKTHI